MSEPGDTVNGPESDGEIAEWVRGLGLSGLVDMHVHFLPKPVMDKVWAYFDKASEHYGMAWPIHYRLPERERIELLRSFGVSRFAPLVYPHKPDMAAWLSEWARDFAAEVDEAVPSCTLYPEPEVTDYVSSAIESGARIAKMHVQVGAFDPRDPLLTKAWGMLAEARVPVIVHCGHGPIPGAHTGLEIFEEVLAAHPRLTAVLAHAGMPDYAGAFGLVERYPNVHIDTTMVGTEFANRFAPLPSDWTEWLARFPERVVLGTDFPNIPYDYATQLRAIADWAAADDRLGTEFLRRVLSETPSQLLDLD